MMNCTREIYQWNIIHDELHKRVPGVTLSSINILLMEESCECHGWSALCIFQI